VKRIQGVESAERKGKKGGALVFWLLSLTVAVGIGLTRYYPLSVGYAESEAPAAAVEAPASVPQAAAAPAPSETVPPAEGPAVGNYLEILKLYKNLQQDQDNILTQLKIAYGERDKVRGEVEILKDQSEGALKDKKDLQKQNADLRKSMQPMTDKVSALEKTVLKMQRQSEADQERIATLSKLLEGSEVAVVKDELKEKERIFLKQKAEFEKMIQTANSDRENVQSRSVQKENRIYNLEMELADMTGKYESSLEENRSLRARFETVNGQMLDIAREKDRAIKETADMHYNLGVFYVEQKNFERAAVEFEKAVEWRPEDAPSHYNLGLIYSEHLRNEEKAISNFQRYLDLQPEAKDRNYVEGLLKTVTYWRGRPTRT